MDFQKKYPILQLPNEHILIQWEKGYKYVELYFKERLIGSVTGFAKLKRGVKFNDVELGLVELKLSEKPIAIDLIVAGYHSPVNVTYPTKELKSASTIFFALAVLAVICGSYEGMSTAMNYGSLAGTIMGLLIIFTIAMYATTGFLIMKGHAWAFFMGGAYYTFFTLLYLYDLLAYGFYFITFIVVFFRVVMTFILFYYIKHASASMRHRKFEHNKSGLSTDILDGAV